MENIWKSIDKESPKDGDYVLVSSPYDDKFGHGTVVKLAIFMRAYRADNGQYAANGWYNEDTCKMINGVKKWCHYPKVAL